MMAHPWTALQPNDALQLVHTHYNLGKLPEESTWAMQAYPAGETEEVIDFAAFWSDWDGAYFFHDGSGLIVLAYRLPPVPVQLALL